MSEEVDPVPFSDSEEEEQLLFDREQLTNLVFKCNTHDQKLEELEEKFTTLSFLFLIFVISFASLAYVLLERD